MKNATMTLCLLVGGFAPGATAPLASLPDSGLQEPSQEAPSQSVRILVTNDDGWESAGLAAVVRALGELGEVVVSAPSENRSGSSQSTIVLRGEHIARQVEIEGASEAWSLEGTPADAAAFGILALGGERGFDLVVSGINAGANVGEVAHYSGTVGAAMEAVGLGVPAIAVSQQDPRESGRAARFTLQLARRILSEGADPGVVYAVNVPRHRGEGVQPVVVAPMGGRYLRVRGFRLKELEDGSFGVRATIGFERTAPEGTDTAAYQAGAIAVTPLHFNWTHEAASERMAEWGLLGEE
jgi:5'-nucleotidase